MRNIKVLIISLFLVFSFACNMDSHGSFGRAVTEEKTLTFKGVDQLKVRNITGSIQIIGWDRDYVEVSYTKKAINHDVLGRLRVMADKEGKLVNIETDYPRFCRRCGIKFIISVPKTFDLIAAKTITGSVSIKGMDYVKRVVGECITGSVKVNLGCKDITLSSITGSIGADLKKIEKNGELKFSLTTGSIRVYLPDNFAGDVRLRTITGRVSTDFPISMTGRIRRKRLEGTIGQGSMTCTAKTITGSIRLLKH